MTDIPIPPHSSASEQALIGAALTDQQVYERVADLVRAAPDPSKAVVGPKNHGLTITGHSLDEIFARIDGHIVRAVPMD